MDVAAVGENSAGDPTGGCISQELSSNSSTVSFFVEKIWISLCQDFSLSSSLISSWWKLISLEYTLPHRAYHTLQHLQEFLHFYQQYSAIIEPMPSLSSSSSSSHHVFLFAIFFHDVIYNPTSSLSNEDESILLFQRFVKECQNTQLDQLTPLVIELIDLTKKHQFDEVLPLLNHHLNAKLFCDMDMAILGSSRERYQEYSRQVRFEYQHIPLSVYIEKRSQFLSSCLPDSSISITMKRIFHTDLFYSKYEHVAYENIRWEIKNLQEQLPTPTRKQPWGLSLWGLYFPIVIPLLCLGIMSNFRRVA